MNENARRIYVAAVAVAAVAASAFLYLADPSVPVSSVSVVAVLCALALVAEALSLLMPDLVMGSVAFIPYLTAALLVPNWVALAGVVVVRLMFEIMSRRPVGAAVYNIASHAVTFSGAVFAYRVLGGQSMMALGQASFTQATLTNGLPSLAAFVASFALTSALMTGYVATKAAKSFGELWTGMVLSSSMGLDVLASPIIFLFAWLYVNWGAFGAALLWVPVIGLRQLHKNNLDLERTNSELLELMVKSMEARDQYTSGHSRRVQHYSLAIARGLSLSTGEVDRVGRAALLHDVGKIHDKYAPILRKPGKLSPDEWQTMQRHPIDGAELVSTMSRLHDVVPSIRHHHERWDGTGYPDGLAGETIPKISRVIAFADTIDAMISERPYRSVLSEQEVRAELVRCRGTQFDPEITDKVLSAPIWRHLFPQTVGDSQPAKSTLSLLNPRSSIAREA